MHHLHFAEYKCNWQGQKSPLLSYSLLGRGWGTICTQNPGIAKIRLISSLRIGKHWIVKKWTSPTPPPSVVAKRASKTSPLLSLYKHMPENRSWVEPVSDSSMIGSLDTTMNNKDQSMITWTIPKLDNMYLPKKYDFTQRIWKEALLRLFTFAHIYVESTCRGLVDHEWGWGVWGVGAVKELVYQPIRSSATPPPFLQETKYTAHYSCPYKHQYTEW